MRDGTYAVIPVKPFTCAKRRLAPILNSFERARLARLMLEDVLDAVRASRHIAGFFIVTCDPEAAALAKSDGKAILESRAFGFAEAAGTAARAIGANATSMVVIPSDIPHLPSKTIDAAVAMTPENSVTLVPAICDGGTNLMVMRPCGLFPPLFGPASFSRHRIAAFDAGATPYTYPCPVAGHDLDRPGDLLTFLAMRSDTRAHHFLSGLGIRQRLVPAAAPFIQASA